MINSILNTCKHGYNPAKYWPERTKNNLADSSDSYYRDVVATEGTKEIFAKFFPYLPEGTHGYLEMGCGYGIWVDAIKADPSFHSYAGVDMVADRIEKARELHPEELFFLCDITQQIAGGRFDVVFFNTVLQHLPLDQKAKAIDTAKDVLFCDGVLLMHEGRFMDATLEECEKYYRDECPAHMIPAPLPLLREWLDPWKLERIGDCLFVARREACQ